MSLDEPAAMAPVAGDEAIERAAREGVREGKSSSMSAQAKSKIVIDLDGTLTIDDASLSYPDRAPRLDVIAKLREYSEQGFEICIMTARNMRTYEGNVGKIAVHTLPIIHAWLEKHSVPFDEIIIGKPWCGPEGFYVDDRAVRPDEFVRMDLGSIDALIGTDPTN
jgi:capsule biosynthesis phosphatase